MRGDAACVDNGVAATHIPPSMLCPLETSLRKSSVAGNRAG